MWPIVLVDVHRDIRPDASRLDIIELEGKSWLDAKHCKRIMLRLSRLHTANVVEEMNLPGFDFHGLLGFKPTRYTVHVNGPWCIAFGFDGAMRTRSI